MLNIYLYFLHKRNENEDFQLSDIDPASFEDFMWSPALNQMRRTREDMRGSSSTKGRHNLSKSSISPAHARSTSSSSTEASPSITDDNFLDSQLDSEPSTTINQLFYEMMDPSAIMNGEGGSHEPCANSSSSFDKEINGEGDPPKSSETPSSCTKCSNIKSSDIKCSKNVDRLETNEDPRPSDRGSTSHDQTVQKPNSSTTIPSSEHSLGTIVEEESSTSSSITAQKDDSSDTIESN